MAEAKKTNYGNESISSLKGADRVRKRPGVIFGSDGLDGCEHAVFEILSNSIDEAREGHGKLITVTRYLDHSIEVEDMGRGCPVDYNPKEKRFNWELVYCELYAGGKYNNLDGDNYEYSLGLNGLGACATQYSSRYMDVTVWRDGNKYSLHFERGEPVGKKGDELRIEPTDRGRKTGTRTRWLPDLDVFTDIDIPADYYVETLRRQAVVNAGITFRFKNEVLPGHFETQDFVYENGIIDYVAEIAGEDALTTPVFWETERRGRDREDKPEYKVKLSCACCFSNKVQRIEHYHNSSWLEHGGSPEKASKTAFVYAIDKYLKDNKYRKVLVKAMMTLNSNYRTPAGDILHGGSNPSYNGFINGIWSWDSWKIASGNVHFNEEIAKSEMITLFDYQADNGMVPDFISYNKKYNNWRDAKPPVAAWGAMNVYKATGDKKFLETMFDKLYKFHQWWYAERDHNHNGICEYGSTDGTLIAACWESGMDNGVRFDDAVMQKNSEKAWSMNQENICLNSFLYVDKTILAEMATLLNKPELAAQLNAEAKVIKEFVQTKMWDKETGFFYDTRIDTGEHIKVMGAECWLPLWAGIATPEQAKQVMQKMMDPQKFNSTLPLGTLDISHPRLRPVRGYWRGPVWVDQVYFGITGLRNYGFDREADILTEKFINNAQGLTTDGPIHENYNPLTGEALNSPNFGWSSACIIKMLLDE